VYTRVRHLAGVRPAVLHEVTGPAEPLIAVRADVVLDAGVCQHVVLEGTDAGKSAFTLSTMVRTFTAMNSQM